MSGFTEEQITSLQAIIVAAVHESFDKRFGPLPPLQLTQSCYEHSAPPAPQAQKEEEKEKPLYQATVEDDTVHDNTMPESKSTLSTKVRLCTAPASRDPAACLSKAQASSLTSSFGSFFGSFLTSLFGSASRFGYIRCIEGMEASGEG